MVQPGAPEWAVALGKIPSALYAMTAAYDGECTGHLVRWVQPCGWDPPLVAVASPRGRPIAPLIRDSRAFAICQIDPSDCFLLRTLKRAEDSPGGALDPIECETLKTGSPCISRAVMALDCELSRHLDLDSDHELYIGAVLDGKVYDPTAERVCVAHPNDVANAAYAGNVAK